MKINLSIIILLVVVLITPNRVMAGSTLTAQYVLEICANPDMALISFCNGFFQAVHDQQATAGKVCVREGTNRTHLVEAYANTAAVLVARELSRITRQLPDMLYLPHSDMLECRGTVTATIPIGVYNPSKC